MQRTFCSAQEFLDYDAPTRLAKTALIHHLVDCRSCLGRIGRDDYSFTERKPISFNDERKLEPVTKPERVAATFKCARPRCWNSALMHQFLRENFGGFESCGCFGRPKNAQTFLSKQIDNSGGERVFAAAATDDKNFHSDDSNARETSRDSSSSLGMTDSRLRYYARAGDSAGNIDNSNFSVCRMSVSFAETSICSPTNILCRSWTEPIGAASKATMMSPSRRPARCAGLSFSTDTTSTPFWSARL